MKKIALALGLCLSAQAFAQAPPGREALANNPALFLDFARKALRWDEPAEPARIVGPIYSVGTRGLSVFLIKTTAGHILINSAMPGSGPMTEAAIRKLGLDPRDIKLLLSGHAHSDHAGAHAYLQRLSGARVAMIQEEKDLLESGGKLDFHYADPVKVDWVFRDGDTIKLGDVAITALLTNGHTKGSTTFVTNVVDDGQIYTVVFPNGLSINPGYRVAKDPSYPGIGDNFRRTLHTLEMLKPDIWLAPHTETYGFEAKLARTAKEGAAAWVDPEGYRRWLVEQRENFEATVNAELGVTAPAPPAPSAQTGGPPPILVDATNFVRAETDRYFAVTVNQGAFGKLVHARSMTPIDAQDVVRMNRDTLYSSGVFDLDRPVTITLPNPGRRFMSMQVVSQDHFTTEVVYGPGRFTYTKDKVGTRYVFLIVRTLTNPEDPADLRAANLLQDAIRVDQAQAGSFVVPPWDTASLDQVREALSTLGAAGSPKPMFGARNEVDPVGHLIGAAIGWGGNPDRAAMYSLIQPAANDGTTVHKLTVKDVPVDGFWSLSLYNARGFFEKNSLGAYSLNSLTAKPGPDGSYTVQFGGCQPGTPNCLPIMPGWNYTVRQYRPRKALLDGAWTFPVAQPVP